MGINLESVVERKIDELQGHRDKALRDVLKAFEQSDHALFKRASQVFEASEPTMKDLKGLMGAQKIAVDSLVGLMAQVELTRQDLEQPELSASQN